MLNWNDATEDLLNQILQQTPRPEREGTENKIRTRAEQLAADEGASRVGVETLIQAWVETIPEALREDVPRQMEKLGLDPEEYQHLL